MLVLCHMVKRCWGTDGSMQTRLTVMRTVWIFNTYKWREKNGMWILSCKTSYRAVHNITSCSINVQLTSTTVMFLFWQTSATSKHFQRCCRHITQQMKVTKCRQLLITIIMCCRITTKKLDNRWCLPACINFQRTTDKCKLYYLKFRLRLNKHISTIQYQSLKYIYIYMMNW